MSAFPHAEKFIEVNQILAKGGDISTLDRATISAFMASLVHEIADKEDALGHFAAENQRLVDAHDHALKKHNEQRGAANDLRDQLAEARSESLAAREQLDAARKFNAARNDASALREQHLRDQLAEKEDALEHFAAENQRLVDAQEHALMSLQGGVEDSSESYACSPSYTMVTHAGDKPENDDCSPIPRCRQEAAEWAKTTDPDGKPLPLKDARGDEESSDDLELRFFRSDADGKKVEIDAPDSWGNTDSSEEDEDEESDSDMVVDDKTPFPRAADTRRQHLGAFDPKDPFGVLRDGIRAPIESAYDDKKEKERQDEVLKEFIRIKRVS